MNIPEKIRIGNYDYSVNQSDKTLVLKAEQCKATIDFDFHQIKIDTSIQDKQGQEQSFLHEVVHGIINERSLDLANSDEETIVEEISKGLYQVIRDNPDIFREV